LPIEGLGTTNHPVPFSDTALPLTGLAPGVTVSVPSGGGLNGAGSAGVPVDPVTAKSGVMRWALQLLSRQPKPNVACRLASSE
jgi:hypothetical protein